MSFTCTQTSYNCPSLSQGSIESAFLEKEEEGTPPPFQNKQEGKKKEEHVTIQVEPKPDAPQRQGVAAQSSFNHPGPMADSESGIMANSVLIILVVAGVIIGLDWYFRA